MVQRLTPGKESSEEAEEVEAEGLEQSRRVEDRGVEDQGKHPGEEEDLELVD